MGLLRAIQPWNEWIMGWGFDISKGEPEVTEAQVRARLNAFVGEEIQEVEIEKVSYWYVNQTWATQIFGWTGILWWRCCASSSTFEWFRF